MPIPVAAAEMAAATRANSYMGYVSSY
jgi:hypothetical protein